jgi:transposase
MAIVYVGVDLAKNVFAVHAVDEHGKPALVRPSVPRARPHELIATLPPCTVAMEACSGGHHWARLFTAHGHTVRLIAPKFVAPYRMGGARGKNDAADAAPICEAVQRPSMRFVPVKSIDQQARLMVHRARQGYVEARTATINRLRGLLSELGIVLPFKAATVRREAGAALEELPGRANTVVGDLLSELHRLDERIAAYDQHVLAIAREDERARQLMRLSGVGPTTATALLAMIGNGHEFLQPAVRGLAGPDARAVQLGRQDPLGAHHQGRRRLPARDADPGGQGRARRGEAQDRQREPLGARARSTTRLLDGGGGRRGEERAPVLGDARARRALHAAGVKPPIPLTRKRTESKTSTA